MSATDVSIDPDTPDLDARGLDDAMGWRTASVCRKYPTTWWFAGGHQETALAKDICSGCTVQRPCLDFALSRPDLQGIWAATTATERVAMRRERRAPGDQPEATGAVAAPVHVRPPSIDVDIDLVAAEREPKRRIRRRPQRGIGGVDLFSDRSELLTPAEAAHHLGVTPNTVTRWSRAGKIAAIQTMGGHRRFRRSEVERVLREANLSSSFD